MFIWVDVCSTQPLCRDIGLQSAFRSVTHQRPAVVVAVVFTLDHFVTTQRTMEWTKSLLNRMKGQGVDPVGIVGRVDGLI